MGLVVVGLGPGNGRTLTREVWQQLETAGTVYLRTSRHPAVADLPESVRQISFDAVYDAAENFEAVYAQIVAELLAAAQTGPVVYAVPGHPFIAESTVTRLVAAAEAQDIPVTILPGLSFVEPALTAVRADGLDGLQLFDALDIVTYHHPPLNPDVPLLLGQVYSRLIASELKLTLTAVYPEQHPVSLIHAAGTVDELVETIPLYEIDRSPHINHLTSLFVPSLPAKSGLTALAETVAILRSPEGCPWDQEQTPQSMREGFLEETAEVLAALDVNDHENLREELGDLLYHIIMQVQMAAEEEIFRLSDVVAGIEAKLRFRHPHVWGDWQVSGSDEVLKNWEVLKKEEKGEDGRTQSILHNIPGILPALARAQKIQKKVAKVGFDWPDMAGVWQKLDEEMAELQAAVTPQEQQAELGDILFVLANIAKWLKLDAETALREANLRFTHRFQIVESLVAKRGLAWEEMDLAAMDALWLEAKKQLSRQ